MADAPTSVQDYLAALPAEPRAALESLRRVIASAAPEATETFSYGIPGFKVRGRLLLSYAAYRNHCSLYPASRAVLEACGEELKPYLSEKATVRFQAKEPLGDALVKRIVEARLGETATR
jgi:uncharacterized protein YdhG (YjbR/CyaY superfamily)